MSISPSIAYNLQNHGTDYNLATSGSSPSAASSRVYTWQATNCGSGTLSYLVDTLSQKCLSVSLGSITTHDCSGGDQAWLIQEEEDSVDTYTIQNVIVGGNMGFLSLYEDRSFNLSDGSESYSRWSFQSETPPENVGWDVCAHVSGSSSSGTEASSALSSATSTQAVIVTASSSLGAIGTGGPVSSNTADTVSKTSTLSGERFSAEATAGASSSAATGTSSPAPTTQTPSGSSVAQSNDTGVMKVAHCILLTALMVGASVALS